MRLLLFLGVPLFAQTPCADMTRQPGGSGSFALGHPEKIIDFARRAVHETAVAAKALIAAYYGRGPRLS